jgi:uncharacterized protein YjbI with pentapeptide repeats
MIIEELVSHPSNAPTLLVKYRGPDGYADISDDEWGRSLAVIKGVEFDRIQLMGREIGPNFVECNFKEARFVQVATDAHFWGAGNRWHRCLFSQANLKQVISPRNKFTDCIFENVTVANYQACETIFTACKFAACEIQSLRTVRNLQRNGALEPALQFVGCIFDQTRFVNCSFKDVVFRNCTFRVPVVENCDFAGIDADVSWWPRASEVDLFVVFLDQVIEKLHRRLGNKSKAAAVLQDYRSAYVEGRTASKDYSADLYAGGVSDKELDVVEEVLDKLGPRFGF